MWQIGCLLPACSQSKGGKSKRTVVPEFDPPYDLPDRDISQLLPWTEDGFFSEEVKISGETNPDPPWIDSCTDPPPLG